jgi:hypothetical protein
MNSPKYLLDKTNRLHLTIPHISKAVDFPVPRNRLVLPSSSFWHNGALYVLTAGGQNQDETPEDGARVKRWTLAKWQEENGWQFLGDYREKVVNFLIAIPCDDDRFIVVASSRDLSGENNTSKRTPFHRVTLSTEKKELRLNAAIDHGLNDIRNRMSGEDCFALAYNSRIATTDDFAVIINYETGLYWIFSLEKATLRHAGNIFKSVTPEMIAKGGFPDAILSAHPEKDGTILISAQEESAFLTETGNATKEVQEIADKNPDLSAQDLMKISDVRYKELVDRNPLMVWYRINPETGKVEKLDVPPIGAAYIRKGGESDYWRPMPDGSVRMGSLHTFLKADGNNQQQSEKPFDPANEKQPNDDKNKQERGGKPPSLGKQRPAAQKPTK